jgi:hypothetical protein
MSNVEQGISNIEVLNRKSERNLLGLWKISVYHGLEALQSQRSFFSNNCGQRSFQNSCNRNSIFDIQAPLRGGVLSPIAPRVEARYLTGNTQHETR